jgi:hypothetical protein
MSGLCTRPIEKEELPELLALCEHLREDGDAPVLRVGRVQAQHQERAFSET